MKGVKITILSLIALLLLDSCSIQSRRYRKGFHVESLAKRSKSSTINTKEVNQLVKIASDKSEKQDLVSGKSDAESGDQVSSKAIAKKRAVEKTVNKVKLAKHYKTIKTFKKSNEDDLQKKNRPVLLAKPETQSEYNHIAVGSFVAAIASMFATLISGVIPILFLVGLFLALISFILSLVALSQIKKDDKKGKGLAIAALVLSIIYFIIILILIIAVIAALSTI
jgi:hypothetical protein